MGKIAIVFSGQGAQYIGMGLNLYKNSTKAKEIFEQAESIIPGLTDMCFYGNKADLDNTKNTQPCLFTVNCAAAAALKEINIKAEGTAGFSLGELSAAYFSGIYSFKEGLLLAKQRGAIMQKHAEKTDGCMAAVIGGKTEEIEAICFSAGDVFVVNYNSPNQVVISGTKNAVDTVSDTLKKHGLRVIKLAVGGAFHSIFMQQAAEEFSVALDKVNLSTPKIPLYSNFTSFPYGENKKELLTKQIYNPVKWVQTIKNMVNDGFDTFIEAGAGKVLRGLICKTIPDLMVYNTDSFEEILAAFS